MAKLKGKGTALQLKVAEVFTTIAQAITIDKDEMKSEEYESDTLDNTDAGIPYSLTGRSEGGSLTAELFFDPALTIHKNLLSLVYTPAASVWQLIFANTATTTWPFNGAGIGIAGPKVALKDGVKATLKIKLDGLPAFPA